jgi:hypothetical protein
MRMLEESQLPWNVDSAPLELLRSANPSGAQKARFAQADKSRRYPAARLGARSVVFVAASQPKDNWEQGAARLFSTHGRGVKPNFSRIRVTR